jgi:predicted nucleotidyltransferase
MDDKTQTVLQECKTRITEHYGGRFRGLVLYGSYARGEETPGSDLDLLVLLDGPVRVYQEISALTDILYPLGLESEILISAMPTECRQYQEGAVPLYREARREGVAV